MIEKNDPRLTDFVLDELSEADHAEIQNAITNSPELKSVVDEIRQTVSMLDAAYQTEEPLSLREGQKAALALAGAEAIETGDATVQLRAPAAKSLARRPWLSIGLAAGLMGILVGGAYYFSNPAVSPEVAKRMEQLETTDRNQIEALTESRKQRPLGPDQGGTLVDLEGGQELGLQEDETDKFYKAEAGKALGRGIGSPGGEGNSRGGLNTELTDMPSAKKAAGYRSPLVSEELDSKNATHELAIDVKEAEPNAQLGLGGGGGFGGRAGESLAPGIVPQPSLRSQARGASSQPAGERSQAQAAVGDASGNTPRFSGNDLDHDAVEALVEDAASRSSKMLRTAEDRIVGIAEQELAQQNRVLNAEPVVGQDIAKMPQSDSPKGQSGERAGGQTAPAVMLPDPAKPDAELGESNVGPMRGLVQNPIEPEGMREENKPGDESGRESDGAFALPGSEKPEAVADSNDEPTVTQPVPPAEKQELEALARRNAKVREARTWKRVEAIPNTTRLMVGDKDELDLTGMQVNVQIDGFRARVLIDSFYYNDRATQLEGDFKLRLPDDASLFYFAFGESSYDLQPQGGLAAEEFLDDGTQFVSLGAEDVRRARKDAWKNVKESRMVPREKAAHAFRETVRGKIDPALVEWSGAGVFNARVFPLAPHKLHRIVIGYDVNLTQADGKYVYELELPEQPGQCQVDINVRPIDGAEYSIEPNADPFETKLGGKLARRYQFKSPQAGTIRLTASKVSEILLQSSDEDGEFWGVQITPELPAENVAGNPQAIFLLDTSLSSNPDKFNIWLKMLESTLSNNRDSLKQFNVGFFNVDAHFWQDKWVDNTAENTTALIEKCHTLALEGATDLYGAIESIGSTSWVRDTDRDSTKPSPGPDIFLLSDGAANWGETNLRLIGRQLQDQQLGSLFAFQTGMTGTSVSNLRFLAGETGGAVFSVTTEDEIKTAATAHRKRPWKLASIKADGASDVMTAGRVQWIYPGQSITIVGRGTIDETLEVKLTQAGSEKTIAVSPTSVKSELAARLYGQVAVGQLESLGAKVFDVAASYARHFRVTGETCSLLMLESEADYQRFDIKPQEDLFVIKSQLANDYVVKTLEKSAAELADPKAQLMAWLDRLETMPGMSFQMPTALELALDKIEISAVSKSLDCQLMVIDGLSKEYLAGILSERLDYELISREAKRRGGSSIDESIKVLSSLVERNPGDLVIARDVAYSALEMGRPAQAYHLLRSVAVARPFEGSIYPALGQCLMQLGEADMAIVYYEIALGAKFNRMGSDFKQIVSAEYMYLLRQIVDGRMNSSVEEFAQARLDTLKNNLSFESADVLITMMWNTDETDVDLHIVEPSGEECSYENTRTRSGGMITSDITTGFGPEMYTNAEAPSGKYDIKVKYFAKNQNRTELRNKVHLTIYRGFGTQEESLTRRTVELKKVGEKESVATIGVD